MRLRTRIFLSMSFLALGIAILTWTLSFFFLEPFYLARKRNELREIARRIGPLPDSVDGLSAQFAALERSTTVHITIVDASGFVAYDSNLPDVQGRPGAAFRSENTPLGPPPGDPGRPPPFVPAGPGLDGRGIGPPPRTFTASESEAGTSVFETMDPRLGVRLLFLTRRQESGFLLALSFPLAQIRESARSTSLFLLISCLLALVAGAGMSFALARGVTRPFAELMEFSKSLAALDFSRRFESGRRDEVAVLGRTMNELSGSLERALAELKEKNQKLQEDVTREQRIDSMRREFISSVSHELKTPISLILGYAEGLLEDVPGDGADRAAYLDVIIDEARKMDAQVRDLLELSQLESGTTPLRTSDFDLGALAEEVLESFECVLKERGVAPVLRGNEAVVRADREKIRRVIVNYLTNALSHLDDSRRLELELSPDGPFVRLSVFNSGTWIPEESMDLIWTSYYRLDAARSRPFGGTGLGLAIVKGIVARHGGTWNVENLPADADRPAGVRFSFAVPAGKNQRLAGPDEDGSDPEGSGPMGGRESGPRPMP